MMTMLPRMAMALLLPLLLPALAHAAPVPGQVSLRTAYAVAIRDRIIASWLPPASMASGQHCRVAITQQIGRAHVELQSQR